MTTREEVYTAIDTERDYQDAKIKKHGPERGTLEYLLGHTIDAYLVFMEDYLAELRKVRAREWGTGTKRGLDIVRKVAGLAVACMEDNGAPRRTNG